MDKNSQYGISALLHLISYLGYITTDTELLGRVVTAVRKLEQPRRLGGEVGCFVFSSNGTVTSRLWGQMMGELGFGRANIRSMLTQMERCLDSINALAVQIQSVPMANYIATSGNYGAIWLPGCYGGIPALEIYLKAGIFTREYTAQSFIASTRGGWAAIGDTFDYYGQLGTSFEDSRVLRWKDFFSNVRSAEPGKCYVRCCTEDGVDLGSWPTVGQLKAVPSFVGLFPLVEVSDGKWHATTETPVGKRLLPACLVPSSHLVGGPGSDDSSSFGSAREQCEPADSAREQCGPAPMRSGHVMGVRVDDKSLSGASTVLSLEKLGHLAEYRNFLWSEPPDDDDGEASAVRFLQRLRCHELLRSGNWQAFSPVYDATPAKPGLGCCASTLVLPEPAVPVEMTFAVFGVSVSKFQDKPVDEGAIHAVTSRSALSASLEWRAGAPRLGYLFVRNSAGVDLPEIDYWSIYHAFVGNMDWA